MNKKYWTVKNVEEGILPDCRRECEIRAVQGRYAEQSAEPLSFSQQEKLK